MRCMKCISFMRYFVNGCAMKPKCWLDWVVIHSCLNQGCGIDVPLGVKLQHLGAHNTFVGRFNAKRN